MKYLSVELEDQTQDPVGGRMLRPEVELGGLEVPLTRWRGFVFTLVGLKRKKQTIGFF